MVERVFNRMRLSAKRHYIGVIVTLVLLVMAALLLVPSNLDGRDTSLYLRLVIGIVTAGAFLLTVLVSALGEWRRHHWRFGLGAMLASMALFAVILWITLYG
jgi:uncharacterized membrane protein AbrB (regulator of aidB expression)